MSRNVALEIYKNVSCEQNAQAPTQSVGAGVSPLLFVTLVQKNPFSSILVTVVKSADHS